MTGELHAVADPTGLWASLSSFEIGSTPSAFERRLAAENGWSEAFACRVIAEYRRFLYLASVASFEVTPSKPVDAAWHLHLQDEAHYREALCDRALGRFVEHRPGTGDPLEEQRFRDQYRSTLALYESVFGPAPADIWPRPDDGSTEDALQRSTGAYWLLASGVALAGTIAAAIFDPAALPIGIGLMLAVAICFIIARLSDFDRKRRGGGSCGGSCGDAGGSDDCGSADGGDCAGCGGGCGGGD